MRNLGCFLLGLFVLVSPLRAQSDVPCPVPGFSVNPPSEEDCQGYSACVWVADGERCELKDNSISGYIVSEVVDNDRGFTVRLAKADPDVDMYGAAIMNLNVDVIYHEAHHVQVKITDANNARYEVPWPLNFPKEPGSSPLYDVSVPSVGSPFELTVTRKSTGVNVFESVGVLLYENQFLEISTKLPSSYLYGLGENSHATLRHAFDPPSTQAIFNRDQPFEETKPNNMYGTHPYYLNIEDEYGNTHSVLHYGSNAMEYSTFKMSDGSPAISLRTIGGIFDLHFFMGPTPAEVDTQYYSTIGTPVFPPYFMFGNQLSRYGYNTSENYRVIRQRMKDNKIPQDVQFFDADYMEHFKDFTVDATRWPDFKELIDELHADNVKVVLIHDPAIIVNMEYEPFTSGRDSDVFVKWGNPDDIPEDQPAEANDYVVGYLWPDNKTVFPDFFNPDTEPWWETHLANFHDEYKFDGLWIDMNEPADFGTDMDRPWNYPPEKPDWSLKCPSNSLEEPPYPTLAATMEGNEPKKLADKTLCLSSGQTNGQDKFVMYDTHSLYGFSEMHATSKSLQSIFPGQRQVILTRSTFVGSGVKALHWLGDNASKWEHLRLSIVGMIEFNLFGIPFVGADVCGFFDEPTEELCIRWTQAGSFYPFSRNHNSHENADQDPARPDWETLTPIARDALLFRYAHIPYFYTRFHLAHMYGISVVRGMFSNFPTDMAARDIQDQFMWGKEIMVAPVMEEGAVSRNVYFPKSRWYEAYSGTVFSEGEESLKIDAPLDYLPVYYRGGSIIATQPPEVTTADSLKNDYNLVVALSDRLQAVGQLYVDDFISMMNMPDTYLGYFDFDVDSFRLVIEHDHTVMSNKFLDEVYILGYPGEPSQIIYNGAPLETFTYDTAKSILTLKLHHDLSQTFFITFSQ